MHIYNFFSLMDEENVHSCKIFKYLNPDRHKDIKGKTRKHVYQNKLNKAYKLCFSLIIGMWNIPYIMCLVKYLVRKELVT